MAKQTPTLPPDLTDTEADLIRHIHSEYQLETTSLGGGPLLRNLETNEVLRTVANQSTINALAARGLIRPAKGPDPLTTIWRMSNKPGKTAKRKTR